MVEDNRPMIKKDFEREVQNRLFNQVQEIQKLKEG